ncbi:MAG: DUF3822 family protein [Hymenobacteraceae bacterium]|nr:DUF3822 family protein [Hymenobacteraceae bacterium]
MSVAPAPAAVTLKPVLRLHDETFDPTQRAGYGLYVVARADGGLRLAVVDTGRTKFVALEDYDALSVVGVDGQPALPAGPTAALRALAHHHGWLGARGWHHVRVAVHHERVTLLPTGLFRPADAPALLALHCDLDIAHERVLWHSHPAADLTAVFATEAALPDWLAATYGAGVAHVLSHLSGLLEGVLHQPSRAETSFAPNPATVHLHVCAGLLTVAVVRGRKLDFTNVFAFTTPEDLVYFTILVMQELQLTPEQVPVTVWGDLTPDAALLALLRRYVRTVRLGERPPDLQYTYRLDQTFPHRYFELFALHLCG